MGRALYCFPLAFLFIANAVSSNAQKEEAEREQAVAAGGNLTVECALRPEQRADWRLDGAPVPPGMLVSESSAGAKLTARLYAPRARPLHAGVYTCAQGSQRIRVRLTGVAAGTEAAPLADAAAPDAGVTYFELRGNFSLNCTDLTDDKSVPIVWTKDDKPVESVAGLAGHVSLLAAGGAERALLTLASRALETDAGNYTCRAGAAQRRFTLHARPIAKLPADTNVVEGQKLKLTCKILGLPLPPVRWLYSNVSAEDNMTDAEAAFPGRVELRASEQGVAGGELVLAEAARADAGWFRCEPLAPAAAPAATRLRVKDMYAALWPFLGICAEVFILCTIILVYEKRRTKPELDDSDTDNHDQKKS